MLRQLVNKSNDYLITKFLLREFCCWFNFELAQSQQNQSLILSLIQYQILTDFSSVFMDLDICIFLPYIYSLLNKHVDGFFINSHNRIKIYTSNASIMHIFFWHFITQKVCFYFAVKFSLAFMYVAMKFNA